MFREYGVPVIFLQAQQQTDWAMLLATAFMAAAAGFSAYAAIMTYRSANSPLVIAHLAVDDDSDEFFFKVENVGKSPAYGIVMDFSEPISPFPDEMEVLEQGFIGRGIPMLAPGDSRVTELARTKEYVNKMKDRVITVSLTYFSGAKKRRFQKMRGDFAIDANSFIGFTVDSFEKRLAVATERIANAVSASEDDAK